MAEPAIGVIACYLLVVRVDHYLMRLFAFFYYLV